MALNVLVVDDSAVMRSMLIRTLRLSGLPLTNVYQAGNGAEALASLAAHEVDLALVSRSPQDGPHVAPHRVVQRARMPLVEERREETAQGPVPRRVAPGGAPGPMRASRRRRRMGIKDGPGPIAP